MSSLRHLRRRPRHRVQRRDGKPHTVKVPLVSPTKSTSGMPFDPLKRTVEFPHSAEVYPLGFAVVVRSNDAAAISAARQSWPGAEKRFDRPALEIDVGISPATAPGLPPEPTFHARWHLTTIVADRLNFASIDGSAGKALIRASESTLADSDYFRWYLLEAAVYVLLAERALTPLHAACVARDGRGVLLVGESGAGKSTLAFEFARQGWQFVADDASWLARREPGLRILAPTHRVRLRPDSAKLFPELADRPVNVTLQGKQFIDVDIEQVPGIALAGACEASALVFLRRDGTEPAAVNPVSPDEAYRRLAEELVVYDTPARKEQLASLQALAAIPAHEIHYRDSAFAVSALCRLL